MKIKIDEFRSDQATEVAPPLDFETLRAALAAYQAAMPTARMAQDGGGTTDPRLPAHAAVAALSAAPGGPKSIGPANGSFHAAAAARFTGAQDK